MNRQILYYALPQRGLGQLAAMAALCTAMALQPSGAKEATPTCKMGRAAPAGLSLQAGWVRASLPGQTSTGAFGVIHNDVDREVVLKGVCSPRFTEVQVHSMAMQGDVMQMREVHDLKVPAHGQVALDAGSYHLMIMGLSASPQVGEVIPFVLHFNVGDVAVQLPVRPFASSAAP